MDVVDIIVMIGDVLRVIVGILLVIMAVILAAFGAMVVRVIVQLVRIGPRAARESYEKGHSVRAWWAGESRPPTELDQGD